MRRMATNLLSTNCVFRARSESYLACLTVYTPSQWNTTQAVLRLQYEVSKGMIPCRALIRILPAWEEWYPPIAQRRIPRAGPELYFTIVRF